MKKWNFIVFIGLLSCIVQFNTSAQINLDSLHQVAREDEDSKNKVLALNELFWHYAYANTDTARILINEALNLAIQDNYITGLAKTYRNFGNIELLSGNFDEALKFYGKSLPYSYETNDIKGLSSTMGNMGSVYYYQGDFSKALMTYNKVMEIDMIINDQQGIAIGYSSIANIHHQMGDYTSALENYFKSLKIHEKYSNQLQISQSYANIGLTYNDLGDYNQALKYLEKGDSISTISGNKDLKSSIAVHKGTIHIKKKEYDAALKEYQLALEIKQELGIRAGEANVYSNMALVYSHKGDYSTGLELLHKALEINLDIGNRNEEALNNINIGHYLSQMGNHKEGKQYLMKGLVYAQENSALSHQKYAYEFLYHLMQDSGNSSEALEYYKLFISTRDSIFNEEKERKQLHLTAKHEFDKKEAVLMEQQQRERLEMETEQKKQRAISIGIFAILLIVLGVAFIVYRKNKLIQRQKYILEETNQIIALKQEEIKDSINYAKRIQHAILPSDDKVHQLFPQSFIYYNPKDIVSGDFYWLETYTPILSSVDGATKDNLVFLAAADCTGHGVPGAMVSVVCHHALNQAIRNYGFLETGEILDKTRELVIAELGQKGEDIRDGMDISLLRIKIDEKDVNQESTFELEWSGAHNPLWSKLGEQRPEKLRENGK